MTDTHIRLLPLLMNQSQRQLAHHHSTHQVEDAASQPRGEHLERAAARTRAHFARARTRRHHRKHDAITEEQTQCPDLGSRTREESAPRLTVLRLSGHTR